MKKILLITALIFFTGFYFLNTDSITGKIYAQDYEENYNDDENNDNTEAAEEECGDCKTGSRYCDRNKIYECVNCQWQEKEIEDCAASGKYCNDNDSEPVCIACKAPRNSNPGTSQLIKLGDTTEGMICSSEAAAWYKVSVPTKETFYMDIYDGFGQVYFELYDSSGKKHLTQDNEFGSLYYTNNGNRIATYLLKVHIDKSKKNERNKKFRFQGELRKDFTPMERMD